MPMDGFAVIAEPTRRRILDQLRRNESTVGTLVGALRMTQPSVSKHLRVLREAGVVDVRGDAQRRIYRLEPEALGTAEEWLARHRGFWQRRLDALEAHIEKEE